MHSGGLILALRFTCKLRGFECGPVWTRTRDLFLVRADAQLSLVIAASAYSAKVSHLLHLDTVLRSAEYRYVPPTLVSGLVANGRLCGTRMFPSALRACSGNLQGGVRQQAQGDVTMPGIPAAHLILVQPHLLRTLETLLDSPTPACYSPHSG
jgi:hypothetical protein